jgi:hypothetical protein
MNMPLIGMRYGTALKVGRATIYHKSLAPPVIAPPIRFAFLLSSSAAELAGGTVRGRKIQA